jgi:hypothetical protein
MTPSIIKIASVSPEKKDTKGRTYVTQRYEKREYITAINPETGEPMVLKGDNKTSGGNQWKTNIKGDPDPFWGMEPGQFIPGDLPTLFVEPYSIPTEDGKFRWVNRATVLVVGDSTAEDWQSKVWQAFGARGFTIAKDQRQPFLNEIHDEPIKTDVLAAKVDFDAGAEGENAKQEKEPAKA